jgi:tRNA modification GTPase
MYELNDIIVAAGSGNTRAMRHIIRLSGSGAAKELTCFSAVIDASRRYILPGKVRLAQMSFDAAAYIFPAQNSYTGDELIELHVECPLCVVEKLIEQLCLRERIRLAGPGEFTARAFLNGKLDLTQAEAVAQIVSGSNEFQLQAAQKLLKGRLSQKLADLSAQILELLSLIEAGLDFSEEDITFITESQALRRVGRIVEGLEEIIANNVVYERMIGLPSVAITGCPNAGKSLLMNAVLGSERCIVSPVRATTRDVISEVLELGNCACVLSDCAGIIRNDAVDDVDSIAQAAAREALNCSDIVVFCVDASKDDFDSELAIFEEINKMPPTKVNERHINNVIALAVKSDMLTASALSRKLSRLEYLFQTKFMPLCSRDKDDVRLFLNVLEREVALCACGGRSSEEVIAVNRRHYEAVENCLAGVRQGLEEIRNGNDELASMYLRGSCCDLGELSEQQSIDERILDKIFSNFCIGK